jgi:hypothetical protein
MTPIPRRMTGMAMAQKLPTIIPQMKNPTATRAATAIRPALVQFTVTLLIKL